MESWLVIGASGFLGWNARKFLRTIPNTAVVGASRSLQGTSSSKNLVEMNILDEAQVKEVIHRVRPTVVLHSAALVGHDICARDPDLAYRTNVVGTATIAQQCSAIGARLIYISTDAVFDGSRGNYLEEDLPNPFSVYGETKLLGEIAALTECRNSLVVRTNFFGQSPGGSASILEFFVNSLSLGRQVPGFTDYVVTSLYLADLLRCIADLAAATRSGLVHVASADPKSKFEFGCLVADQFGFDNALITPVALGPPSRGNLGARNLSLATQRLADWLERPVPTQCDGIARAYHSWISTDSE